MPGAISVAHALHSFGLPSTSHMHMTAGTVDLRSFIIAESRNENVIFSGRLLRIVWPGSPVDFFAVDIQSEFIH